MLPRPIACGLTASGHSLSAVPVQLSHGLFRKHGAVVRYTPNRMVPPMHAPFRGCKQWLSIMLIPDIVSRVLDVVGKHLGEFWPYRDGALTPYAVFETAAAVRSMSNLQAIVLESTSETSSAWAEPSRVPVSHSSAIKACSIEA